MSRIQHQNVQKRPWPTGQPLMVHNGTSLPVDWTVAPPGGETRSVERGGRAADSRQWERSAPCLQQEQTRLRSVCVRTTGCFQTFKTPWTGHSCRWPAYNVTENARCELLCARRWRSRTVGILLRNIHRTGEWSGGRLWCVHALDLSLGVSLYEDSSIPALLPRSSLVLASRRRGLIPGNTEDLSGPPGVSCWWPGESLTWAPADPAFWPLVYSSLNTNPECFYSFLSFYVCLFFI